MPPNWAVWTRFEGEVILSGSADGFRHRLGRDPEWWHQQISPQTSVWQLKLCLPLVRFTSFDNPQKPCMPFWGFGYQNLFKIYITKFRFSKGYCLKRFQYNGMVVNSVSCAWPSSHEGKVVREVLIKKKSLK